jgi:hypothetical protein
MSLILRPLRTGIFGFGQKYVRNLANREDFTIPAEFALDKEVLAAVRSHVAAGYMQVVKSDAIHGISSVRPSTARKTLLVQIGAGGVIPNGATLNKVTLGRVPFTFGNSNIDGATTAALLAAFLVELAASTDFAATGATVRSSTELATPAAIAASGTLTAAAAPANNDTVTIGGTVYTFKTAIQGVTANEILVEVAASDALDNLIAAITGGAGSGTKYGSATVAHTTVTAAAGAGDTITVTASTAGSAGNAIATTETGANLSFGAATLTGGADTHAVVIIDGDDVADWTAFGDASSVTGSNDLPLATPLVSLEFKAGAYATGTLTSNNTNVTEGDTVTIVDKVYTFMATPAEEGDVDIGADADGSLLNLIRAINHSGTPDTNYVCALPHPHVTAATSVTSHAFAVTARVPGTDGNSIPTTEVAATLSWGAATLAGGTDVLDTIATDVPVYVSRTVTAADVSRGYIELDTGLTNLSTKFAVRITRSGTAVLHDGTVNVKGSAIILIQNNGSVDFVAGDIVQAFAAGAD